MTQRTVTSHLAAQYERQVARVADHLRKLADDIDNMRPPSKDLKDLKLDFLGHARDVEHKLRTAMFNMPFDALLTAACDADRWVRSSEAD